MKLSAKARAAHIETLTTNCECWKGKEGKEALEALNDDQLSAIAEAEESKAVANEALQGFADADLGIDYRYNPESGEWEKRPVSNKGGKKQYVPDEDDEDDAEEEDEVKTSTKLRKATQKSMMGKNERHETDDDIDVSFLTKPKKAKTLNEWLAEAPPEGKEAFEYTKRLQDSHKQRLVERLVANVEIDARKEALAKKYMKKTLPELIELVEIAGVNQPTANEAAQEDRDPLGLSLWQGAAPLSRLTENEQDDVLDLDEARKSYDPLLVNKQAQTA